MSWLLFLDESGTDHGGCPYEVTGGVAIHASRLWPFIKDVRRRERDAFGGALHEFGAELKGCKLLNRTSYQRASQGTELADVDRQRLCRSFLTKGLEHRPPNRMEFTAFGQARLAMAKWIVESLLDHGAVLFAAAIPRGTRRPRGHALDDYLRKDHVFLLERFFYFLERERQHGILVMDAIEKGADRSLAHRMERYFEKTPRGGFDPLGSCPPPFLSRRTWPIPCKQLISRSTASTGDIDSRQACRANAAKNCAWTSRTHSDDSNSTETGNETARCSGRTESSAFQTPTQTGSERREHRPKKRRQAPWHRPEERQPGYVSTIMVAQIDGCVNCGDRLRFLAAVAMTA